MTTTTKIAGEAAMTDKMQANDRPTYIFLAPGDVIRATDERYSSTYHKWKSIAPLYVGSTVDASTRPVRRRALLESKPAVAQTLPQPVIDALRFYAHGHHFNIDADHQQFDTVSGEPQNWLMSERDDDCTMIEDGSIAKAVLLGGLPGFEEPTEPLEGEVFSACTAPAQSCGDAEQADEAVTDDVLDWLETEVTAISCRYHGDPSYDHDAYWMRDRVVKLIGEARNVFTARAKDSK